MRQARAGWYDDPHNGDRQRWWNGEQWALSSRRKPNKGLRALIVATIVLVVVIIGAIGFAVLSRAVTNYKQNQYNNCVQHAQTFDQMSKC